MVLAAACRTETAVHPTPPPITTVEVTSDFDGDGFVSPIDCDDGDPAVYPGAEDLCGDDRRTDCRRAGDEGLITIVGGSSFVDLQDALDAARDGDTLRICPGTYSGPLVATRAVHLVSHRGRASVVLDGMALDSTLELPTGSTLEGVRVINGFSTTSGGGVRVVGEGPVVLRDVEISGSFAWYGGGLYLPPRATAAVWGCEIASNSAVVAGGGVFVDLGGALDLDDSVVHTNNASAGGGIALVAASVSGGESSGNLATGSEPDVTMGVGGGGIACGGGCSLTGTRVADNLARRGGGLLSMGPAELVRVVIEGNTVVGELPDGAGGGLWLGGSGVAVLVDSVISGNEAGWGGGAWVEAGAVLSGGRLRDNEAVRGGGVYSGGSLDSVVIQGNTAALGGGAYEALGKVPMAWTAVAITGNTATLQGGGLFSDASLGAIPTFSGGRIADNVCSGDGGGIYALGPLGLDAMEITDNTAYGVGGALLVAGEVWLLGGSVLRNSATEGGGAWVLDGQLGAQGVDFGTGVDENDGDVFAGLTYEFGEDATFMCDPTGCGPWRLSP